MDVNLLVQTVAIYALPVLFAITLHEAAHGYVARYFGDMHPRYELEREYAARIRGELLPAEKKQLLAGIEIEGQPARFERIENHREGEGTNRWYRVVLKEGRNREVRRLFEALGHPVSRLVRLRYGPVSLPADLAPGRWHELRNPAILQRL